MLSNPGISDCPRQHVGQIEAPRLEVKAAKFQTPGSLDGTVTLCEDGSQEGVQPLALGSDLWGKCAPLAGTLTSGGFPVSYSQAACGSWPGLSLLHSSQLFLSDGWGHPPRLFITSRCQKAFNVNEIQLFHMQMAQKDLARSLLCVLSSLQDQRLFSSPHVCSRDNSLTLRWW